jgi:outer membrane protein OmpA-like peptidoglycan-associated protein
MNNSFGFEAESCGGEATYSHDEALTNEALFGRESSQYQPEFTPEADFESDFEAAGHDLEWETPARSPGFGNAPQSFALRIRIIGYASPRWRSAKSATEADQLNFKLSANRAESVRVLVEKELRAKLGKNIKIDYAVSQMEPGTPRGIELGSYGVGSADALAGGGNRQDNSEINRKVEVMIEKITTTYTTGGVSLPPQRLPGKTDSWAVGITKLRMLAIGGAIGSVELVLRNRYTDKQMYATANLYGGGLGAGTAKAGSNLKKQFANATKNHLMQAVSDFLGRGEVFFTTKNKMGFDDFDNQFIRLGKASAALGLKAVYAYAVFPFITHDPKMLVFQQKITVGWPDLEGWVASGRLHLRGTNPGDWVEYDKTDQVNSSYDKSWQETLLLTFPTGKSDLLPAEKSRLTDFVATWARRFP